MRASEWTVFPLEEIATELTVGYVGPMATEYLPTGIPFLRSLNVEPFRISKNELKYVSHEFHKRIQKSALSPGDVVIVRTGKPGTAAVIPEWLKVANCSDLVVVRPGSNLDSRFLAYFINGAASHHVFSHTVGAVQQHFNVGSARTLPIPLPPLATQRAIARILGALDDKIELNRRMNRSLEQLAHAVFGSWFVDFDPVTAKAIGRNPVGLDESTADLFPAQFEDSEFGDIPKNWRVVRWGEIATLEYGKSLRNYRTQQSGYRVFGTNGPIGWHSNYLCPTAGIVVGRKGAYRGIHFSTKPFFVIDTAFYLKPISDFDLRWAYYELIAADLNSQDSGSAIPSTSREDVYSMKVCLPSLNVLKAFGVQTRSWFEMIDANNAESETLAAARDALLPSLLSGELRIKDAEKFLEKSL